MITKKIGGILLLCYILFLPLNRIFASDATFSFYPSGGIIENSEKGFTVDVLLNSGGFELTKARMVVKFDSSVIQLTEAYRDTSLFAQYPEDESSTDNVDGIVMLTGYTPQEEGVTFYKTQGEADVFVRLKFSIVDDTAKEIVLDWEYSGEDILFKTVIMKAGDPTTNILLSKPGSATFYIDDTEVPETSISMSNVGIIIGILLILVGGFVRSSSIGSLSRRRGTIVMERRV